MEAWAYNSCAILLPQYVKTTFARDGSGLKRNWLQSTESVNVVGRGRNLGAAADSSWGVWPRVNAGSQGLEPLEAVASFTFETPFLDCHNSNPYRPTFFHLIHTDLRDENKFASKLTIICQLAELNHPCFAYCKST